MSDPDPGPGPTKEIDNALGAGRAELLVRRFRLRVLSGPDSGACHESTGERVLVGTHRSADFVLGDSAVSRFHLEIAIAEGKAVLRDLGSRNGTLIDGIPVLAAPLRDGATLGLGRTQVRFELGSEHAKVPLSERMRFGRMVARSPAMRAVFALLDRAATSDATVLFQGATGTGKDAAAESLHDESPRRDGPFVVVDCGAISPSLLESELFGHERGAFTGADRAKPGAFEAAAGGTLFLDEIGELPLDLQPKLLRAIETRTVQRLGSTRRTPVDVRLMAATNRDLPIEVNERRFRADLYYRLAVVVVTLPPLRDHLEDVPDLVDHFLEVMGAKDHPRAASLRSPPFLAEIARHRWPGNIRELRNHVERRLALEDPLPLPEASSPTPAAIDVSQPLRAARERWLLSFERGYLEELLRAHGNNVRAAAQAAGMNRTHLYRLMTRCGLR